MDSRVDGKASTSALNSLKNTVSSLSTTVSGQGNTLGKKGNCQVAVTSYTGNGQDTRTHTFPKKPVMFFIIGNALMFVGYGSTWAMNHDGSFAINTAWSGTSGTLSVNAITNQARAIANVNGKTYQIIALYNQEA